MIQIVGSNGTLELVCLWILAYSFQNISRIVIN